MHPLKKVKTFTDRYPLIGPVIWIASIHYFLVQVTVAMAWKTPFSLSLNPISDLGNSLCGTYADRFVCSPQHNLMNASFITLGLIMATGSLLIYQEFKKNFGNRLGFSFMAVAGFGTLLVGLFPENTIGAFHLIGAGLAFLIGNLGIVILGIYLDIPKIMRFYTLFSGILALAALILFIMNFNLGIGQGGMERVTSYPQTLWLIVFGVYISRDHYMKNKLKKR